MASRKRAGANPSIPGPQICLSGDIRANQVGMLHQQFQSAESTAGQSITVDCSELRSIDGAAFQLLVYWQRRFSLAGCALALTGLTAELQRLCLQAGGSCIVQSQPA